MAHDSAARPRGAQTLRLRVCGDSMRPLLRPGDWIELEAIDPAAARPGDVVAAFRGGALVCHRLAALDGQLARTVADAWPRGDPPFSARFIIGRVARVERSGRRIDLRRRGWPLAGRCLARMPAWAGPARRLAATLMIGLCLALSQEG